MKSKTQKRFPWFWLFYIVYILVAAGLIYYGLTWVWNSLDVYEKTRPVHYMEEALPIFEESETAELQKYLTNTVDNPYEDISALLSIFYDSTKDAEWSFGKLSGKYTEYHPVYAVLADGTHVATISFVSDNTVTEQGFNGWVIEEISLLVSPTKSFAVTVPSTMTLTINGLPVSDNHITGMVATSTPIAYVNYVCTGELYLEPDIKVTDRFGTEVPLQKDEATGGLYHQISFATAPATMELSFGGHILGSEHTYKTNLPPEGTDFSFLEQVASHFPEYQTLPELIELPTFNRYFIDFVYSEDSILATDRFGEQRTLAYDETTRTYSHGLVSNDALQEECVKVATEFLEKNSLFVANDLSKTALKPFFPKNSEYYSTIVSMNNQWFNRHEPIKFTNHNVEKFFAYTDNLAYVHVTMNEEFIISGYNIAQCIKVDLPLWLVKMEDNWYVARILFDYTAEE